MNAKITPTKSKQINPIKEAETLQRKLSRIDMREAVTRANMEERYQAERNELLAGASPMVLRIIEASKSEVAG